MPSDRPLQRRDITEHTETAAPLIGDRQIEGVGH